jgi:hypothetical protein
MSMTQRYAGMLRRQAYEWDKQDMPVQAECCRQAARHMQHRENELEHALIVARETLEKECDDGDALLRMIGLDPEQYRTEGGRLNLLRVRAAMAACNDADRLLRAMASQVVEADDKHELTQQMVDLLRAALSAFQGRQIVSQPSGCYQGETIASP